MDASGPDVAVAGVGSGVGLAIALGLGVSVGRAVVRDPAAADLAGASFGTGWIETYRPSQIIGIGAYFHGVKKRFSCAVVSFVFGGMS